MTKKVGGNSSKKGRMKKWCEGYRSRLQAERNKAPRLARHLRQCPWDKDARRAFEALPDNFRKGLSVPPSLPSPAAQRKAKGITLSQTRQRGFDMEAA